MQLKSAHTFYVSMFSVTTECTPIIYFLFDAVATLIICGHVLFFLFNKYPFDCRCEMSEGTWTTIQMHPWIRKDQIALGNALKSISIILSSKINPKDQF